MLGWIDYFERRPVDWRDDDRTYKLLRAQGTEQKAEDLFPTLGIIHGAKRQLKEGEFDPSALKGSVMFQNMLTAKGGDKLEF